jgi:uroporphyrinogen III methyltransferase / synthase
MSAHKPSGFASPGTVHLVGAGPGDPELMTAKALRLLGEADVVVHDSLVSPDVLARVKPGCELIFAGKRGGGPGCPQAAIDTLLVELALQGRDVVRLKGGDPFIFGRGGEEAAALVAAGIPFEVVPGVTSALAAAAYAGIPLTHRVHSSAVVFLTGHEDPAKPGATVRWEDYARLGATLCVYMGMRNLAPITARLQAGGMPADTPAALIQSATTPEHRTVVATLGTLADRSLEESMEAPVMVVIGAVVALSRELAWFEAGFAGARAVRP